MSGHYLTVRALWPSRGRKRAILATVSTTTALTTATTHYWVQRLNTRTSTI
nr:MAG TPA: hypothetical protein [Caudoviricetes sp.]